MFVFLSLCRLLKDTLQDSQFSVRYQYLLAALLCCSGRGLRDEFDRQCWLVNVLAKVAQQVRDSSPSSRQVSFTIPHLHLHCYFSIYMHTWSELLVLWVNMIKEGCGNKSASVIILNLLFKKNHKYLPFHWRVEFKIGDVGEYHYEMNVFV